MARGWRNRYWRKKLREELRRQIEEGTYEEPPVEELIEAIFNSDGMKLYNTHTIRSDDHARHRYEELRAKQNPQ